MLAGLGLQRTGNTLSSELGVACGACARARSPAFNSQAAAIDSAMMFGTCALAGQQACGEIMTVSLDPSQRRLSSATSSIARLDIALTKLMAMQGRGEDHITA